MWPVKNRSRRVVLRAIRRALPQLESCERRELLTLNFTSAIGVSGSLFFTGQVAIDASGNTYLTGGFSGQVNFDPQGGPAGLLDSGSLRSGFVAKYAPSGALDWVKEFAAQSSSAGSLCAGEGLAVSPTDGTVYVCGAFGGTVDFNAGGSPGDPITASGSTNAFIVALSNDGVLEANRTRTYAASGQNAAVALQLSPDGSSIFVSGTYSGIVNFDVGGTNKELIDPSSVNTDTYVLKLASNFTGTTGFGYVQSIAQPASTTDALNADGSGNVYVVGTVPESTTTNDAFLAKLDPSGNVLTVRHFGGPAGGGMMAAASSVAIDNSGNVYVGGLFNGTGVNFATNLGGAGGATLDSAGDLDGFLIKLDPSLNLHWARRVGSTGTDQVNSLTFDRTENTVDLPGFESGATPTTA